MFSSQFTVNHQSWFARILHTQKYEMFFEQFWKICSSLIYLLTHVKVRLFLIFRWPYIIQKCSYFDRSIFYICEAVSFLLCTSIIFHRESLEGKRSAIIKAICYVNCVLEFSNIQDSSKNVFRRLSLFISQGKSLHVLLHWLRKIIVLQKVLSSFILGFIIDI